MSRATTKNKLKGELLNGLENSRERKSKDTDLNLCDWKWLHWQEQEWPFSGSSKFSNTNQATTCPTVSFLSPGPCLSLLYNLCAHEHARIRTTLSADLSHSRPFHPAFPSSPSLSHYLLVTPQVVSLCHLFWKPFLGPPVYFRWPLSCHTLTIVNKYSCHNIF